MKNTYIKIIRFTLNLLQPTDYVIHQQFNIQQLYVLPTPYLCVLYLSENKQRLVPLTAKLNSFYSQDERCLLSGMNWVFKLSSLRVVVKWLGTNYVYFYLTALLNIACYFLSCSN